MELTIVSGAPPRTVGPLVAGRTVVGRVVASLAAEVYRIAIGSSTVDVRSELPLAVGQELTLKVEGDARGLVLRILPGPAAPTGPAASAPPPVAPIPPLEIAEGEIRAALREAGLPLDKDRLAPALALLESLPAEPRAVARAAAHLLARGVVPEGRAAEGLAELLAGRTSLPAAGDLRTVLEMAAAGRLPEAVPLAEHPILDPRAAAVLPAIDELPRRLEAVKAALEQAVAKRLAGEPRLAAVDAALERLDEAPPAPVRPEAVPPREAAERLEKVAARVLAAVESGDREAALAALDEELPRLDDRDRREVRERVGRLEEKLLEKDDVVREARTAHREVESALGRAEAARLARLTFQADREPVVYVGSAPLAGLVDGRLHVFRRKGSSPSPDGALSLWVDLRTPRLGRVTSWVRLVGRAVAVRFGVETDDVRDVLESGKPGFLTALSGLGYAADVGIEVESEPPPEVGFPAVPTLLAREPVAGAPAPGRIDLWI